MKPNSARIVFALGLMLFLLTVDSLQAQVAAATLSGTVTNNLGAVVPNAKITVKNLTTGTSAESQASSVGEYKIANLTPGDYEISVSAEGFASTVAKVTLAAGTSQTLNLTLNPALSVEGLGFPSSQTQGSAQEQARLDKRSHMLKTHQRLGLITAVPLVATVVLGTQAGGKATSSTTRDVHAAFGAATTGLYFTTAYYAVFAPKVPGTQTYGQIRLHKALAWIHGPGMILTPILGAIAFSQKSNGEKVHGIASAHGPVAIVTAGAYGAAILAVSVKF